MILQERFVCGKKTLNNDFGTELASFIVTSRPALRKWNCLSSLNW